LLLERTRYEDHRTTTKHTMRLSALLSCCALFAAATASAASTAAAPAVSTARVPATDVTGPGPSETGGGKNPVVALAGFVKDQVVRMKDGTIELYTNHKKCNDIRSKQKEFAVKSGQIRRDATTGGITYAEYDFLQRGKDDRGKLGSLLFMMFFAPNFLPYAIMFNPGMMPSPFKVPPRSSGAVEETRWEAISRQRTHAVIGAMMDMEKSARVAPAMAKMNPFGGAKTKRNMERIDQMAHAGGAFLAASGASGLQGGADILSLLSDKLYKASAEPFTKKETQLVAVPKPIIKGLASAISAESPPSGLLPNFILRGQVVNHIQKVATADEFLFKQDIDLATVSGDLLLEACNLRLIGGPGRSDDELREGLKQWLNVVVAEPKVKTDANMQYNSNLARAALMGYNAVDGARDDRSSSYLPRLLFQGQYGAQSTAQYEKETASTKRGRRRK